MSLRDIIRKCERVTKTIKEAEPVRGFEKRKSRGNPAGPYENLASNSVLNLIKTRNPPRGRPAGTCQGCEKGQGKFEGEERGRGEEEMAREALTAGMPP